MSDPEMTTGEAEAWRAGWRAAIEAAAVIASAGTPGLINAAIIGSAIRTMEPPA